MHQKHPVLPDGVDESGLLENSNEGQHSNYDSNYPDGAKSSSGERDAEGLQTDSNDPSRHRPDGRDDLYGPAPPRDEILPPELDKAASEHPADGEDIPASVATEVENKEYLRHFSSPEEYKKWLEKVARESGSGEK